MKRKVTQCSAILVAIILSTGGLLGQPGLRKEFSRDFLIGTALNKNQILGHENGILSFVARQFSAITAENEMKWENLNPVEGTYEFAIADKFAEFSNRNEIHLTGHALVWHQQTPDWVFEDGKGGRATRELLLARMEKHIKTVVGRYRGVVDSWDVVNEALNEDGSMRKSKWFEIIGEDFIEKAFEYAHRADPAAKLYYNDYNLFKPAKRDGAIRIVKRLQRRGIPIDGIGMQAHYSLDFPGDLNEVEESIKAFSALKTDVLITELDVSVLPFPADSEQGADIRVNAENKTSLNPYVGGLPAEVEKAQAEIYKQLFRIFLRNRESIKRVTFWGVNDGYSWKNNWPVRGRTDYPLLFDRNNRPKQALVQILAMRREMTLDD